MSKSFSCLITERKFLTRRFTWGGGCTVHYESHLWGLWTCLNFCFPNLGLQVERLKGFLIFSSKWVVILWGSIKDNYDVHVLWFSLRGVIKLPFVECWPIEEGSSVVQWQSQGLFGGIFLPEVVLLEGDGIYTMYHVVVWNLHWVPRLS